jgi:phosphoglycolate phosphatase-like HAD superfamily hydrolase
VEKHGSSFEAEDVYVIGDTPRDIDCARAAGFVAVAIATGSYGQGELAAHKPDFLFEDLSDTRAVLTALFEE